MGYNPYECIVCGIIKDNGWNNTGSCQIIRESGVSVCDIKLNCLKEKDGDYLINEDVCNDCLKAPYKVKYICVICADDSSTGRNIDDMNELSDFILNHSEKCWIKKIPPIDIGIYFDVCDDCYVI